MQRPFYLPPKARTTRRIYSVPGPQPVRQPDMGWPGTARTRATVLAMAATSGSRRFDGHKAAIVVEHRLARLVQLRIRQSRYFGRTKTRFQLYLAATVANLTLAASKAGLPEDTGGASKVCSALRTSGPTALKRWVKLIGAARYPAFAGKLDKLNCPSLQRFRTTRIIHSTVDSIPARLCQIWALALLTSASLPKFIFPNRAFRPDF